MLQAVGASIRADVGVSLLRRPWSEDETEVLRNAWGNQAPGRLDFHYALMRLPGRSASAIFTQWKLLAPSIPGAATSVLKPSLDGEFPEVDHDDDDDDNALKYEDDENDEDHEDDDADDRPRSRRAIGVDDEIEDKTGDDSDDASDRSSHKRKKSAKRKRDDDSKDTNGSASKKRPNPMRADNPKFKASSIGASHSVVQIDDDDGDDSIVLEERKSAGRGFTDNEETQRDLVTRWAAGRPSASLAAYFGITKSALYKRITRIRTHGTRELKRLLEEASVKRNAMVPNTVMRKSQPASNGNQSGDDFEPPAPKRAKIVFDNCTRSADPTRSICAAVLR